MADRGYRTRCRVWTGARTKGGYGARKIAGRVVYVHRVEWELARGPIPAGLLVCHHCDQPDCARVDHLFLGTQSDNLRDAYAKGRATPHPPPALVGESNPRRVLSLDQVRAIRAATGVSRRELARRFGVGATTVHRVVVGETWRDAA